MLSLYGSVLTAVELLVVSGAIHTGRTADRTNLAWHAYLWDPWFLAWGVLVLLAMMLTRPTCRGE